MDKEIKMCDYPGFLRFACNGITRVERSLGKVIEKRRKENKDITQTEKPIAEKVEA
jgi:hypothetical protein